MAGEKNRRIARVRRRRRGDEPLGKRGGWKCVGGKPIHPPRKSQKGIAALVHSRRKTRYRRALVRVFRRDFTHRREGRRGNRRVRRRHESKPPKRRAGNHLDRHQKQGITWT